MATFITSKAVGQTIRPNIQTSTGFWKYNHDGVDSSVKANGMQIISVSNIIGEFTIISCLSDGTVSGDVTSLLLKSNQLTSFDGTGLTGLTTLNLGNNQLTSFYGTGLVSLIQLYLLNNQLTSFDGTGLSSLTYLNLAGNQLTSFDGTDLSSLTYLNLYSNQLTSFDGTDLSNLTNLNLQSNQLTSFDGTGLSSLTTLSLSGNQLTPSVNNQILQQLNQNGLSDGYFSSFNGRTSASNADYDNLVSLNWGFEGLDLLKPTFITSHLVGETINIYAETSTGFWKYNHDGSDSSVNANGWVNGLPVANANGEFTIISCDESGTVSGDITYLNLRENQLTSFDGTGLSSLTNLELRENQLTSFDGTGLSSLTNLYLSQNLLTSFDGTDLSSLTTLSLEDNQLTSFVGTGLSSLTYLILTTNQLTSFVGTGLSSLTNLQLQDNQLTSLDVSPLVNLSFLQLHYPSEKDNPALTNPITPSVNNQILFDLSQHSNVGTIWSIGGRTSASNADYNNLISLGWLLAGLDLITPPPVGNGKLRVKGVTTGI